MGINNKSNHNNRHIGHRSRMRNKFLNVSPESFEDHELIEMLLYYVNARQNTNDIAHCLLDRFGTVRDLLEASHSELMDVSGVGERTSMLFMLTSELMRRYHTCVDKKERFNTIDKIGKFFVYKFVGMSVEAVYALLLDNSLGFIDCKLIYEGSVNSARFDTDKLYQYAFSKRAANVIIAHNHPRGLAIPSEDDKNITRILAQGFDHLGINLLEHIIVAGERFLPVMRNSEDTYLRRLSEDKLAFEKIEFMTGKID